MSNFWKDHYAESIAIHKTSLLKQVGKTVNGVEIDDSELSYIVDAITNSLVLDQEDTVVDLCCGNGLITKNIAKAVGSLIGVDFSEGFIEIAKRESNAVNAIYMASDVLLLPDHFWRKASKYYMYEALQLFSSDMFSQLLRKMSSMLNEGRFFIGSVPDIERLSYYYDTEEKMEFYIRREKQNNPHMGKWWDKTELEIIAAQHGFRTVFVEQNPLLYTSSYRFDCVLEKNL